jgi:hypothetical protein
MSRFRGILDDEDLEEIFAEKGLEEVVRRELGEKVEVKKKNRGEFDLTSEVKILKRDMEKLKGELSRQKELLVKVIRILEER